MKLRGTGRPGGCGGPFFDEQPVVFVALTAGVTLKAREMIQFIRETMAVYKVPGRVVFLPAMPRNAMGGFSKMTLREKVRKEG
jgi:acyl-CoA synthetase (AMP-forming)/AMP-acid ligase II